MPRPAWELVWRRQSRRGNQVLAVSLSVFFAVGIAVFGNVFLYGLAVVGGLCAVVVVVGAVGQAWMYRKKPPVPPARATRWIEEPFSPAILEAGSRALSAVPGATAPASEYRDGAVSTEVEGNWYSLGEFVQIEAVPDSDSMTRITLSSEPLYAPTKVDWGRNTRNLQILEGLLSAELLASGLAPLQAQRIETP